MNDETKPLQLRYQPTEFAVVRPDWQVRSARFSPCGKFLVAADFEGQVRRWDLSTADEAPVVAPKPRDPKRKRGKPATAEPEIPELPPLTGHNGWIEALDFHPHGQFLFTADSWGKLCSWPYADANPQPNWTVDAAHDGWIHQLAVNSDGSLLATVGNDRTVRIWSTTDGGKRHELVGHKQDVHSVLFPPDGKSLLSGDLEGVVKHWDIATGKVVREFDASALYSLHRLQDVGGARCLAFDHDASRLACSGTRPKNGGNVQGVPLVLLFDWQTGKLLQTLELGAVSDVYVCDLRFHRDGFLMAVTSGNPGTGKFLFQRPEDTEPFYLSKTLPNCHSLSLHPNGRRLAIATTSKGSNGNGRRVDKNGEYIGNTSPIHILDLPKPQA